MNGLGPGNDPCVVVNVAEGCNGSCTYCIVRTARGELKSRGVEEVAREVQMLVAKGAVEVQLSAQDTAAYGRDIGTNLGRLLSRLVAVPGDFKLRIGMMNPKSAQAISEDLVQALESEKIYRFLHIPVQSGSDRILESMGRRYKAMDILAVVSSFRSMYPDITIITDVIAGFPGETESDFKETMNIIDLMAPDKVNITRFSARPRTAASKLYDMPDRIKKERSRELTRLWLKSAEGRNERYVGEVLNARVTEQGRGDTMKARADNYLGIVVRGRPKLGSSIRVLVEDCNAFYVSGRAIG
jgi:MiaB/RimO family radical SAM methylthiotransferase